MQQSIHEKLKRVRKPRVHITYDVENNGSTLTRELPFVVGVLGDYSGDNTNKKPLKERKFVNVDRDNLDLTMAKVAPQLSFRVDDVISGQSDRELAVDLQFHCMADFEPESIVTQIPALKALLDARNRLRDLMTRADRSEQLEIMLEQILQSDRTLALLAQKLGHHGDGANEDTHGEARA